MGLVSDRITSGPQQPPADAELMQRLAGGDRDALALLVLRHQHRVRSLAFRMTGRWDQADDLAQEAFLRLWRAAAGYQPTAAFSTWLYRIVVNLCIDARKRRRLGHLPEQTEAAANPVDGGMLQAERSEAVQKAIAGLPERQRAVLVLHRFEGFSHERIAEITGWSLSAVESLLVRAYGHLREQLKNWVHP